MHNISHNNSDRYVFILSLIASIIFWLLIKLSDTYSQNYVIDIHYNNVPIDKQITALIDTTLTVNISTDGYNFIENQLKGKLRAITINLKRCKIKKESKHIYSISSDDIKILLSEYLRVNETQLELYKPVLRFKMEKNGKKIVPVKAITNIGYKSQFGLYALTIKPEKVTVYGPVSMVDTIKTIFSEPVKKKAIDNDITLKATLHNPSPTLLNLDPQSVTLHLDVQKYTEAILDIPINLSHINVDLRTFPSTVKVSYHVAIKDYNSIHPNMFAIEPDIKGVNLNRAQKIQLKIIRKPDLVSQVRIEPQEVEFLIVK